MYYPDGEMIRRRCGTLSRGVFVCFLAATLCGAGMKATRSAPPSRSAGAYVVFGTRDLNHGRWEAARDNFRRALVKDGKSVAAHVGLATAYKHLGQIQRAHEEFAAALRLDPHSPQAENGMHDTMTEAEHEQFFHDIEERVTKEPQNADLLATYAEELHERGRSADAERAAQQALKMDKHISHAQCVLGQIAIEKGQVSDARRYLESATRSDDADDDAFASLGDLDMQEKNFDAAVKAYRRAVKVAPEHAEWHRKLSAAYANAGKSQDASDELAEAQQLDAAVQTNKGNNSR